MRQHNGTFQSIYILKIPDSWNVKPHHCANSYPTILKMSETVDPVTPHNIPKDFSTTAMRKLKSCDIPLDLRIKFHLPPFISKYILSFILTLHDPKSFLSVTKFILYVMWEHPVILFQQVKNTIKYDCSLLKNYFVFNKLHVLAQIVHFQPLYKHSHIFIFLYRH